jgi:hypothetical protein
MSAETLHRLRSGQLSGATRLDLDCGLTEFPAEIFELAETLEVLNLTGNELRELPPDLGRLHQLRILFCSNNRFTRLPAVLGSCPKLTMIGFRANQIEVVEDGALPARLQWLILTENRLARLPAALGNCRKLQKLMLSGNELTGLPPEMAACENLELLRLAANRLEVLPEWLLELPRLAWLALAGNPLPEAGAVSPPRGATSIPWTHLKVQEKLGEGASGVIHRAVWRENTGSSSVPVALKIFKNAVTSDGLPAHEMAASLEVGEHPHLTEVLGRVPDHPGGAEALVMCLIDPSYANLAAPPSFATCTRDVYAPGATIDPRAARRLAWGIASAAAQLHDRGILHGDLYAHNILHDGRGHALLSDFGAASFYDRGDARLAGMLERVEVCAFGYLLEELLALCRKTRADHEDVAVMESLRSDCNGTMVAKRPLFAEVLARLGPL